MFVLTHEAAPTGRECRFNAAADIQVVQAVPTRTGLKRAEQMHVVTEYGGDDTLCRYRPIHG